MPRVVLFVGWARVVGGMAWEGGKGLGDGRLCGGLLVYSRKSLIDDFERHKQTHTHAQTDRQTEREFNRLGSLCFALLCLWSVQRTATREISRTLDKVH